MGEKIVSIGDVSKTVKTASHPEYVPRSYLSEPLTQDTLHHLRWMLQKDLLGQDMFLLGRPGPLRARLALQYLELTGRELEYVALSRDTTESDLKQRREISGGTAEYIDQSAVRAATMGRVLVLQGIEKAEQNVLHPVVNCAVRAATMGRVLVLQGVEKAEQNVLHPVVNCAVRAATMGRVLVLQGIEKAEQNVRHPVVNW
ncbi:von Willebrand factor A domain-containing protein 8 [Homalodisca vitripennis]|nr:von Willebrand factor A domain-containing protein 8 [Homalodisca vitripennis]